MPVVIVENDPVLRLVGVLLDPATPPARRAAFAQYMRHDEPDFEAWAARTLQRSAALLPARIVMVADIAALHAALPDADAVILEDLPFGDTELALAPKLRVVQTFGTLARNIDRVACAQRDVQVRTVRRRVNIAVAEHAMAMLMSLAKQLPRVDGLVSFDRLRAGGYQPGHFDTRHTANANWGRVPNLRLLQGSRLGLLGLGEIGREMARLGNGIGLQVSYFQRHRVPAAEEEALGLTYAGFDALLAESDFLSLHLPKEAVNVLDSAALAKCKRGQILINTARADSVNREALLAALRSGHLGGAALDVHHAEPLAEDDPFLTLDNVILTPHLAGGPRTNGLSDIADMLEGLAGVFRD